MTTLFIVFIIVASITLVYLLIKNKHLSDGLLDHKLYIQKMHAELFPKETSFLFDDLSVEQKEKNRIEEIEKRLKDAMDAGDKNRKALEKYLGITYMVKHDVSEGYEKSPTFSSAVYGYSNSGSGDFSPQWVTISASDDVCEKKKRTKKVAKKSKKK